MPDPTVFYAQVTGNAFNQTLDEVNGAVMHIDGDGGLRIRMDARQAKAFWLECCITMSRAFHAIEMVKGRMQEMNGNEEEEPEFISHLEDGILKVTCGDAWVQVTIPEEAIVAASAKRARME